MWKYERALELLDREGRTRDWLARYCEIEPGSLNQLLSGQRNPGRPVLKLMAQALNTKIEELEPDHKTKAG